MTDLPEKLKNYISAERNYWDFSGVIRVIKDSATLYETSRGFASIEFDVKNTMETRFVAASVCKQFTAFAIMLLYDRGLLQLDEEADKYLPDTMQLPTGITVHQLLCHTSGLHNSYNFEDDFYVGADRLPFNREKFFRDWILKDVVSNPKKKRRSSFDYNNANYNLLAWIIETVSGQTYSEFLEENIFSKLGMTQTAIDDGQQLLRNKAANYMYDYGVLVSAPYTNSLYSIGAGALVTNCDDLQKWYECLRTQALLSARAYQIFLSENKEHYCYGLECYAKNSYLHGGDYLGVSAYTHYFFDENLCILILSNTGSLDQYRLGTGISAILHNGQAQLFRRPEELKLAPQDLAKYTGTYLPGKIHIAEKNGKLYLVRVNENIHIELYCVGKDSFIKRYEEQQTPHRLIPEGGGTPSIWGYKRVSTAFF